MTVYKQLCAELLWELENAIRVIYGEDGTRHISSANAVITKARAELAKPEPEELTKDELWELWLRLDNELPDRPAAVAEFWEHARVHTLARWGNRSAPQPVPVSEPPRPEDCDTEGRCWWLIEPYPRPVGPGGKLWSLCRYCPGANYWLPANALPLPEEVV